MIKISKKIEYALIAIKHLSQMPKGALTSAREIADLFNCPFDTISRVLQTMNSAGILNAIHGPKGGYFLEKKLSDITYMQICQIIESKNNFIDCTPCEISSSCNISTPLKNLNAALKNFFEALTLEQLLINSSLIDQTLLGKKETNEFSNY